MKKASKQLDNEIYSIDWMYYGVSYDQIKMSIAVHASNRFRGVQPALPKIHLCVHLIRY